MIPKRRNKLVPQKHELEAFAEKYAALEMIYGDPVAAVFEVMSRNATPRVLEDGTVVLGDDAMVLRAAELLMGHRYPRVKATEGSTQQAATMNFNLVMQAPPPPTLEVRAPQRPLLSIKTEKK